MSYLSLGDKNEEEGDFFGSPVSGSGGRLGSLFGMNAQMANASGSNQSLTYTAPKPPRPAKQENTEKKPQPAASGVAIAVAVTAYRYVNNQYVKQGKLGAALLSNFAEKDYKILMYVSKQQPVTTAAISSQFQFNIQPNNYATFYDDQRQMWSIMFDSSEQAVKFAKQICLAKFNCGPDLAQVCVQDLDAGEQHMQALESGDSVEAKYTGWLFESATGSLGSVFDSNHNTDKTFRFKVGKGKVIKGWDQGMLGMKKGGKRFLVIPPSLAYGTKGAGNRVPPNSTLAFEVDVLRVKHANEAASQSANPAGSFSPSPAQPAAVNEPAPKLPQQMAAPQTQSEETTVKGRTASFNEQLAKVPTEKANLVSRMARMGHAMFPHQQAGPTTTDDGSVVPSGGDIAPQHHASANPEQARPPESQVHEVREVAHMHQAVSPAHSQSPFAVIEQPYMHNPHAVPYQQPVPVLGPAMMGGPSIDAMPPSGMQRHFHQSPSATPYAVNFQAYQQPFNPPQQYTVAGGPELLPLILTESREQSSSLKSLSEKIDRVSEKVDHIKQSSENRHKIEVTPGGTMDTAMLSHTIQRIVQENDRMKNQVLEKDKLIESQSDKIADLLQKNQKHVEDSHLLMEKRNVSFKETFGQTQARTLQLEQEKTDLIAKLSESTSKICDLQLKLADMTERANSLQNKAKMTTTKAESKVEEEHAKFEQIEQQLREALSKLSEERSKRIELEAKFQEKVQDATADAEQRLTRAEQEFETEKAKSLQRQAQLTEAHKEQVRQMKLKTDNATQGIEDSKSELEVAWRAKCKDAVATVTKAAENKIAELNSERDDLSLKLDNAQKKYENLRQQATSMKEKYETKIRELVEKNDTVAIGDSAKEDTTGQVKSIMNTVFQQVRSKISADDEYSGSDVLRIILGVIKSTTLKLLDPEAASEEEQGEESGEEETEDEESGDEEEESESKDSADESLEEKEESEEEEENSESKDSPNESIQEKKESEEEERSEMSIGENDRDKNKNAESTLSPVESILPVAPKEASEPDAVGDMQMSNPLGVGKSEPDGQVPETKCVQTKENTAKDDKASCEDPIDGSNEPPPKSDEASVPAEQEVTSEGDILEETSPAAVKDEEAESKKNQEKEHSVSPSSDTRSQPPPLFDDDDEDSDDDWLK